MGAPVRDLPRWIVPTLVIALAAIAVADALLPDSPIVFLLVVPVVISGAFLSQRAVVWVTAAAITVITVLTGVNPNDFAESDGWLELAAIVGVGAAAVVLTRALDAYRRRLAAESEQYRMLAENATDVVARISPTGTILWISPSVEQVLGWRPTDLVGSIPFTLISAEDRDAVITALDEIATGDRPPGSMNVRIRTAGDRDVWMSTRGRLADDGSIVVGFHLVDDEVHALHALSEAEAKYGMLAENAMDTVFSLDMDGTIEWVSPSIERLLGYCADDVLGQHKSVLVHGDDVAVLHDAAESARQGHATECRIRMVTRGGRIAMGRRDTPATPGRDRLDRRNRHRCARREHGGRHAGGLGARGPVRRVDGPGWTRPRNHADPGHPPDADSPPAGLSSVSALTE